MKDSTNTTEHLMGFNWGVLFPDILWIIFWLVIIFLLKDVIITAIFTLVTRLKHGASVKIGSFELQELKVAPSQGITNKNFHTLEDINGLRECERTKVYVDQRGVMLVHKLFKSQKNEQLYDILIYVIPRKNNNLIQVTSVEYFFGKYWGSRIYITTDRSNGFAIATSAYGPFLCTARINFNDGKYQTIYRYIDFEMGDVAVLVLDKEKN